MLRACGAMLYILYLYRIGNFYCSFPNYSAVLSVVPRPCLLLLPGGSILVPGAFTRAPSSSSLLSSLLGSRASRKASAIPVLRSLLARSSKRASSHKSQNIKKQIAHSTPHPASRIPICASRGPSSIIIAILRSYIGLMECTHTRPQSSAARWSSSSHSDPARQQIARPTILDFGSTARRLCFAISAGYI